MTRKILELLTLTTIAAGITFVALDYFRPTDGQKCSANLPATATQQDPALLSLVADQQRQIESLKSELQRLSASQAVSVTPNTTPPKPATEDLKISNKLRSRMVTWRAQQFVKDVEDSLSITAEQKEALANKFEEQIGSISQSTDEARSALISEVMGDEAAQQYQTVQKENLDRERNEQLNSEAIIMARKLNLTHEQEQYVREVLRDIQDALMPKSETVRLTMREAMANHLGGDEGRDVLKQQYDLIKQLNSEIRADKDKLVFEQLSGILTDEQKNALLSMQAQQLP